MDQVLVAMGTAKSLHRRRQPRAALRSASVAGRDWAKLYTDDREALPARRWSRTDERVSATEVARAAPGHGVWTGGVGCCRHVMFLQRRGCERAGVAATGYVDRPR